MADEPETGDLLYGVKAIAAHLGLSPKQAEHRIADGAIPTFRLGGKSVGTVCSRRSTLKRMLDEAERGSAGEPGSRA